MSAIGKAHHDDVWLMLWREVAAHMLACNAHAARTVVLLPFFQLQAVARESAGKFWAGSFLPRIETTKSWQQRIAPFTPDALDLSFDAGLDALRARSWLSRSGLQAKQALLAPLLVEAAQQLGSLAAAVHPNEREAWAARMRPAVASSALSSTEFSAYEEAVARIALEWAAASSYASDALFDAAVRDVDALIVVRGVQRNALSVSLAAFLPERALWVDLPESGVGEVFVQVATTSEDEAQRAAACVLAHLESSNLPVALPAIDRIVTRRIAAMLATQGVALRDETGWKLSTTRAAASLMSLLRAASHFATQDEHLDWLKHTAAPQAAVQRLESFLRKPNTDLAHINQARLAIKFIVNDASYSPEEVLKILVSSRPLVAWLDALREALTRSGVWAFLGADAAGEQVLAALHVSSDASKVSDAILQADTSRMSLHEFTQWVQTALEGASFKVPAPTNEAQVVILPLAQLAARPFAALVMAGCDAMHLPLSPDPQGAWSEAQRVALGLPSRKELAREQQTVWQRAMQIPRVDVLWRSFEGEENVQPSPLLQAWRLANTCNEGEDARQLQAVMSQPEKLPAPSAATLASGLRFSASSYQDVRTCPYRFFALRLLGLQESQELDTELSKRDFGSWLHAVLGDFHQTRPRQANEQLDADLLDASAARIAKEWFGQDAGFVPFAASWPQVAQSYLLWLAKHESQGWRFESSELDAKRQAQGVEIQGRLDRVDTLAGSGATTHMVIDYKTESVSSLQRRVKQPLEDTQLVFYAALLGKNDVKAAYLGVAEKETKAVPHTQVSEALPLLLEGVKHDAQRITAGQAMPALGEGMACEYCAARGLCRKDFWAQSQSLDEGLST